MNEFSIKPELITKEMMEQFVAYLQSRSVGEGAKSIYQRFKKVIRYAIDHDVMLKDPSKSVTCKVDSQMLRKDVLSPEEIQKLSLIHILHVPRFPHERFRGKNKMGVRGDAIAQFDWTCLLYTSFRRRKEPLRNQ